MNMCSAPRCIARVPSVSNQTNGGISLLCPRASEHTDALSAIVDAGTRFVSVGSYSSRYTGNAVPGERAVAS